MRISPLVGSLFSIAWLFFVAGAQAAEPLWQLDLRLEKDGVAHATPRMLVENAQPASMSVQAEKGDHAYAIALVASVAATSEGVCLRLAAGEGDSGRLDWQAESPSQDCMAIGTVWRWQARDASGAQWRLAVQVRQGRDPKGR